jgi:formylglycine-generating enzyme required for sulfatase activity
MVSNLVMRSAAFVLLAVFAVFAGVAYGGSDSSTSIGSVAITIPNSNVQLTMNRIPAGTYMMGSPAGEPGRWRAEGPQHSVTLTRGFYMGKYAVTQEQYEAVMGVNPSFFNGRAFREPAAGEVQAKRPVETVRWFDAIVFCNRLSILEGRTPVYSINGNTNPANWGEVPDSRTHENFAAWNAVVMNINANGYRLPTEAEWEYACRAGTTTAFNCGTATPDSIDGYATIVDALGWFAGNSGNKTHQVGLKLPNAFGLYDMHGNVWEWCWDWFSASAYTSAARTNPTGPEAGSFRVLRGGSWSSAAEFLRSALRNFYNPSNRFYSLGFRVVRP